MSIDDDLDDLIYPGCVYTEIKSAQLQVFDINNPNFLVPYSSSKGGRPKQMPTSIFIDITGFEKKQIVAAKVNLKKCHITIPNSSRR